MSVLSSSCMVERLEGIIWVASQILYIKTERTFKKWGLFTLGKELLEIHLYYAGFESGQISSHLPRCCRPPVVILTPLALIPSSMSFPFGPSGIAL